MKIGLIGGWGYNNLGDEAILAGYLHSLAPLGDLIVGSVDAGRTASAQRVDGVTYVAEGSVGPTDAVVLAGGGYLNGSWVPEISRKVRRISRDVSTTGRGVASSVEVRSLSASRDGRRLGGILSNLSVSVRDNDSRDELRALDVQTDVLPDGISLLVPHLSQYVEEIEELNGKVLVNFLDIERRPDANECELGARGFRDFADRTIAMLGDQAVGLVIGDGDLSFMRRYSKLPLVTPKTVTQLVSAISSAAGIVSVRMHPALIASALNTPVASIPYCGKVRPTLSHIGVESVILPSYELDDLRALLRSASDFSHQWSRAHGLVHDWLAARVLGGSYA